MSTAAFVAHMAQVQAEQAAARAAALAKRCGR
jgi:hypothetical protein